MNTKEIREFCQIVRNGNYGNYYVLYENGQIGEYTSSSEYTPGQRQIVKLQSFGKKLQLKDYIKMAEECMHPYY